MRVRVTVGAAVLLLAALTACGGDGDDSSKPKATPSSKAAPTEEPSAGTVEKGLKLGTPAKTTGDGGTGVLEITPDTVVFTKAGGGETAENGIFVVVPM